MKINKFLKCEDCIYSEQIKLKNGICRKNAPINNKFSMINLKFNWCGDFQKKIKCYDCEYSEHFEKDSVICKKYSFQNGGFPIVNLKNEYGAEHNLYCKLNEI
jgi:hypothetical protein